MIVIPVNKIVFYVRIKIIVNNANKASILMGFNVLNAQKIVNLVILIIMGLNVILV